MWSALGRDRSGSLTRRALIQMGAIGLGGLTLPSLLRLERVALASRNLGRRSNPVARARSIILLFLSGGPAHQDM